MCRTILVVMLAATAASVATPAAAQNLLTNPGFNTGLSGWNANFGTTFDALRDANGNPASGSARWSGTSPQNGAIAGGVSQCVAVTTGHAYEYGGDILLSEIGPGGGGHFILAFYSTGTCFSGNININGGSFVTTTGTWQSRTDIAIAPPGAVAANIGMNESAGPAGGTVTINVDNMFVRETAIPVPAMGGFLLSILASGLLWISTRTLVRAQH